ncbi:MAG: hypothetical protein IJU19_00625 [Bacteroidales bacterium]|nr:hypothetical protein [Bacteroidales bacterium]
MAPDDLTWDEPKSVVKTFQIEVTTNMDNLGLWNKFYKFHIKKDKEEGLVSFNTEIDVEILEVYDDESFDCRDEISDAVAEVDHEAEFCIGWI